MKTCINIIIISSLFFLVSCDSWLDLKPETQVTEDELFNSGDGYRASLNGLYKTMGTASLYGRELSFGMVDCISQQYQMDLGTTITYDQKYVDIAGFNYMTTDAIALIESTWRQAFNVVANANNLIQNVANESPDLFAQGEMEKNLILGEAYACRALMHFDMLRLFGPLTSELDKESIPYQTNSDQTVTPLLSGSEVIGLILDDLKNAVGLLKDTDPYFVEEEFSDTDLNYRRFRMNYFAAKGLMARVQLWGGDKEKAAITAKEVIAEGQAEGAEFFPFVTNSEATSSNPDRVFYSEVLFGTYHSSREKLHEDLFAPTLESTSILTLAGTARRDDLYDNENDYRYSVWSTYNKNGTSVLYHRKFEKQDNVTASRQYMIPLIRMSEMYLIAVECCKLGEASVYLNTFRNARNCNSLALTEDNRINILANEYKKEMLGEGQLFFFYKRQEMVNIPDGNQATGTKNVELTKYVVPLPESETDQRISSTDISNE